MGKGCTGNRFPSLATARRQGDDNVTVDVVFQVVQDSESRLSADRLAAGPTPVGSLTGRRIEIGRSESEGRAEDDRSRARRSRHHSAGHGRRQSQDDKKYAKAEDRRRGHNLASKPSVSVAS